MISYEEAKAKAIERTQEAGVAINYAGELPDAYVFDDENNTYDGLLPMVIRKSDGQALGCWHYLMQVGLSFDDIKDIPF